MFITAQVLMVINIIFYAWSLFAKTKAKLFLLETISTCFFVSQYLFLKGWVGAIVAFVDLVRVAIFFYLEKANKSQKSKIITCVICYIVGVTLSIFTWAGWYSIIPLIGLTIMYVCIIFGNLTSIKISMVINVMGTVLYLLFLHSYFSMALEIILLIACIVGTTLDIIKDHKTNKLKKSLQ